MTSEHATMWAAIPTTEYGAIPRGAMIKIERPNTPPLCGYFLEYVLVGQRMWMRYRVRIQEGEIERMTCFIWTRNDNKIAQKDATVYMLVARKRTAETAATAPTPKRARMTERPVVSRPKSFTPPT